MNLSVQGGVVCVCVWGGGGGGQTCPQHTDVCKISEFVEPCFGKRG